MIDKTKNAEAIRRMWDNHAVTYDKWYETFEGAIENYVDWELLKKHLPKDRNSKILDAAGGTGRITLPLAQMGYSVTLCDISTGMLDAARQRLQKEGVLDRIRISECDVCNLHFANESFDFVLCWDGGIEAAKELIRVTKKGGRISIFLINRCRATIDLSWEDSTSALALINSRSDYIYHHQVKHKVVRPEEVRDLFEEEGIRVIDMYAVCGWLDVLRIPETIRKSRDWDENLFKLTAETVLKLSREPSVKGMSKHLVLYGERM